MSSPEVDEWWGKEAPPHEQSLNKTNEQTPNKTYIHDEQSLYKTYIECSNTHSFDGKWVANGKIGKTHFKKYLTPLNKVKNANCLREYSCGWGWDGWSDTDDIAVSVYVAGKSGLGYVTVGCKGWYYKKK